MAEFRTPKGTRDILPPESARWEVLVARFAGIVEAAGYGLVLSPLFENVEVFQRVGESTDIVRKEMYQFTDKGGRELALRPEGTASIVRAFVQHRPPTPWKTWYAAPSFRYEQAQAGRYRQHHQGGIEVLGTDDPDVDVEVIALAWEFFAAVGLRLITLKVNSLGDATCRPVYREALRAFLETRQDQLCDEHRTRWEENPLRVLDCKKAECVAATADAPHQLDYLCDACAPHFARVLEGLTALDIPNVVDPRLVRGLDYYTRTTFEFASRALESAQNALGGGGRYDGLVEEMGGPPTPGIGFGIGLDRTLLACNEEGILTIEELAPRIDVFVVDFAGGDGARDITAALRRVGVRTDRAFGGRSPKSQLKSADRSGARLALIIGPDEAASGRVAIKDLRSGPGTPQELVDREALVKEIRRRLSSDAPTVGAAAILES
ncbi:MAG: histidyl-tRNA synthetase [Acidimicrobiaceae bacterium]|nr:histidyl-tRNA synthetase [Acidimicrobiaceae bacterium]